MSLHWQRQTKGLLALGLGWVVPALVLAGNPFPEPRPANRSEAVELLIGHPTHPVTCLTPRVHAASQAPYYGGPTLRRALGWLQRRASLDSEHTWQPASDVRIRYTTAETSIDRISPADGDRDGQPDLLQAVVSGLDEAKRLLVDRLQLQAPEDTDVLLLDLGDDLEGYLLPNLGRPFSATLVINASPRGGTEAARHAAIHQYAHAITLATSPSFPMEWSEALALWTRLTLDEMPDGELAAVLSRRLERLNEGLVVDDIDLAAGNAIWLAFLSEAYGLPAVQSTLEELARATPVSEALGRAVERGGGGDLREAFREFHLWSILVGQRADRQYFPFAERLRTSRLASSSESLPALSVQSDPPVAPWGAAQIALRPGSREGGLTIHFEGEFSATWEADLILIDQDGTVRRLPLDLTSEGRGQATVPLQGMAEALLLVRNLGSDDGLARRYSYTAHQEKGFPFELSSLEATHPDDVEGVVLSWETFSEQKLVGFNVLRLREDHADKGVRGTAINPVWIPALGDSSEGPVSYRYLDGSAEPGISYIYRLEGITVEGLSSVSDPVTIRRPSPAR